MSNASVYSAIKHICASYNTILENIPEERFQLTPPIGGWSYSEVYDHIFDASLLSITPMVNCIHGEGEKKHTVFIVKLILFFGMFPPAKKFKVPKRLESRVKKINREEARIWIDKFLIQLNAAYLNIDKADPQLKAPHPRLGYLSASQWLRFIQIHLNHHLKQLKRIEKSF